jgi:hypothetical protein
MDKVEEANVKTMNSLSVRSYLDQTVVPILLKGMVEVVNQRYVKKPGKSDRISR